MRSHLWSQFVQKMMPQREAKRRERRRELLLDSPRTMAPPSGRTPAGDVLFVRTPVWQDKPLQPPMRRCTDTQPARALLPPELWGVVIEQLLADGSALAPDALLDLRQCSRYFAHLVDTFAVDFFARNTLTKLSTRQLMLLPDVAVQNLFAQQKTLRWDLSAPDKEDVLRRMLPVMVQLGQLRLDNQHAPYAGSFSLPASLRQLVLNGFDLTQNTQLLRQLPAQMESLTLSGVRLPELRSMPWPASLRHLTLINCELHGNDALDLSGVAGLLSLTLAANRLGAGLPRPASMALYTASDAAVQLHFDAAALVTTKVERAAEA